jgi:phage terminase Nu1 subunit (DNA packaging protein)
MSFVEKISIREFARRLGCSDTAIHKAIKAGRIVEGYDAEDKKIIPDIAEAEYKANTDARLTRVFSQDSELERVERQRQLIAEQKAAVAKEHEELREQQQRNEELKQQPGQIEQKAVVFEEQPPERQVPEKSKHGRVVQNDVDMNAARKAEAVYRAKLKQLEYEEKSGKLVNKQEVYRELFAVGKEIRTALLAVPDRVIDNLLASTSRNEAHSLLYKSISEILEVLADTEKRL